MLPKPEKNRKQLDLVETLDENRQLASKRRLVFVIMSLTILLPLIFMLYRQFSLAPQKQASAPETSFPTISQDFANWPFYVGSTSEGNENLIWSNNPGQIGSPDQIAKFLILTQKAPALSSGPIFDLLPKGLNLRQYNPDKSTISLYVDIPQNPFFLIVKSPPDSVHLAPTLIDRLYWGFTGRF